MMVAKKTNTGVRNKFFKGDRVLWIVFFLLAAISIVEVFSASSTLAYQGKMFEPMLKHTGFVILSIIGLFIVSNVVKVKHIQWMAILMYFCSFSLLIFAQLYGTNINEAVRWVQIFGIRFQPSEIAKLSIVLLAGFMFSLKIISIKKQFYWFLGLSAALIVFISKDNLSTGAVLSIFVLIVSWIANTPKRPLLKTTLWGGGIALAFVILLLAMPDDTLRKVVPRAETWKYRIVSDPSLKDLTAEQRDSAKFSFNKKTFQPNHAKVAVARGLPFGVLPGNSIERDILPSAYSDYIYAIIIEETGLLGAIFVPLIYIGLFFRLAQISGRSRNRFVKLVLLSFGVLYIMQAMLNFTVGTGFIVTGQTLPLISRGGTSYVITSFGFALMLALSRHVEEEEAERARLEEEIEQNEGLELSLIGETEEPLKPEDLMSENSESEEEALENQ